VRVYLFASERGLTRQAYVCFGTQCVNSNGETVAWYALGHPGEDYRFSSESGCSFGVEEPYPHLVVGKLSAVAVIRSPQVC